MQRTKAIRLGLTGGIGSGKSTVAAILAQRGASLIDADVISRGTTAAGGSAIPAIAAEFGAGCIRSDGAMDRDRIRAVIFTDPIAKDRLERIIHPLVGREIQSSIEMAERRGAPLIVVEIPLLVETGRWRTLLHRILVVDCSLDEQLKRVMGRSGLDRNEAMRIVAAQASRETRLGAADFVLFNQDLPLHELHERVNRFSSDLGL
jgi:dephospho-CoA kinase